MHSSRHSLPRSAVISVLSLACIVPTAAAHAEHACTCVCPTAGTSVGESSISSTFGGFGDGLDDGDGFGGSVAEIGDLDADGVADLAVGVFLDDDGGINRGAIWILFMNADGTVRAKQKISSLHGAFAGSLDDHDHFGSGICAVGDVDGDSVVDLAVGAPLDDDGGSGTGAVWLLYLNTDGTAKGHKKLSMVSQPPLSGLGSGANFGVSCCSLGDFDDNGVPDLVVGAWATDDGANESGSAWILLLGGSGDVIGATKIAQGVGGFGGDLDFDDRFGTSVATIGDLDGNGVIDLAVGAMHDDDGGLDRGAVWILFLESDATVASWSKISAETAALEGGLDDTDRFGVAVASIGDLDGDGVMELAVGAAYDDVAAVDSGSVRILFLQPNGAVKDARVVVPSSPRYGGRIGNGDRFGESLALLQARPDRDGSRIASGATFADDGGTDRGAVWLIDLAWCGSGLPLPGDLNADCTVDSEDLGLLLGAWGPCREACPADIDASGAVNGADIGALLNSWGGCP